MWRLHHSPSWTAKFWVSTLNVFHRIETWCFVLVFNCFTGSSRCVRGLLRHMNTYYPILRERNGRAHSHGIIQNSMVRSHDSFLHIAKKSNWGGGGRWILNFWLRRWKVAKRVHFNREESEREREDAIKRGGRMLMNSRKRRISKDQRERERGCGEEKCVLFCLSHFFPSVLLEFPAARYHVRAEEKVRKH